MLVSVELVKAFTKDKTQGNPAGVVRAADSLSDAQMLSIAQTVGFSESAFVQESDSADFKVRFFTPKQEVNFCGHATVATFYALAQAGSIAIGSDGSGVARQETKAGIFPVRCYEDGKIMMTQGKPIFGNIESDTKLIASLLNLDEADLGETPIQIINTVTPVLIVPVRSLDILRSIQPNLSGVNRYSEQHDVGAFYVYSTEPFSPGSDLSARCFDPIVGIDEDAATGSAAGPLGCYANKYLYGGQQKQLTIDQGFDMNQFSTLYVNISGQIQVGGYGVTFGHKELEI
jgi:PhzF family phenazine biosynthesis protein